MFCIFLSCSVFFVQSFILPFPNFCVSLSSALPSASLPSPVFILIVCTHSPVTHHCIQSPSLFMPVVRYSPSSMLLNQGCHYHCSCNVLSSFKSSCFSWSQSGFCLFLGFLFCLFSFFNSVFAAPFVLMIKINLFHYKSAFRSSSPRLHHTT